MLGDGQLSSRRLRGRLYSLQSYKTYSKRTGGMVVQPPLRFAKISQPDSGAVCRMQYNFLMSHTTFSGVGGG